MYTHPTQLIVKIVYVQISIHSGVNTQQYENAIHTTTSPLTPHPLTCSDFHHLLLSRVAVYCHGGGGGGGEGLRLDVLHKEQQHEVDDS